MASELAEPRGRGRRALAARARPGARGRAVSRPSGSSAGRRQRRRAEARRPVGPDRRRDRLPARVGGGPAPELLEADESLGALLLERVVPGDTAMEPTPATWRPLLRQLQLPALSRAASPRGGRPAAAGSRRARREGVGARLAWARKAVERLGHATRPRRGRPRRLRRAQPPRLRRGGASARSTRCRAPETATYDAAYWVHANRRPAGARASTPIAAALGLDRGRLRDWCGVIAVHG